MDTSEKKIYKNTLGNILIEYRIDNKTGKVYMENTQYDDEYVKLFLLTLKNSFDDLIKMDMKKFVQKTTLTDWTEYLQINDKWKLIEKIEENNCILECDMKDALQCIGSGFGIYPDHTDYKAIFE